MSDVSKELAAMNAVVDALRPLEDAQRRRVLQWSLMALTTPQSVDSRHPKCTTPNNRSD